MDAMGQEFRKWIERQHMWGQSLTPLDNSRYTLSTPNAKAHVTLTPLANGHARATCFARWARPSRQRFLGEA